MDEPIFDPVTYCLLKKDISDVASKNNHEAITITTESEKVDSVSAYAENGVAVVTVVLVAGLASGWHNDISLTIPEKYQSREAILGVRRINSGADATIGTCASLGIASLQVYLSNSPAGKITYQFVYPIKESGGSS